MYVCIYIYILIIIYIYRERERDRCVCVCVSLSLSLCVLLVCIWGFVDACRHFGRCRLQMWLQSAVCARCQKCSASSRLFAVQSSQTSGSALARITAKIAKCRKAIRLPEADFAVSTRFVEVQGAIRVQTLLARSRSKQSYRWKWTNSCCTRCRTNEAAVSLATRPVMENVSLVELRV